MASKTTRKHAPRDHADEALAELIVLMPITLHDLRSAPPSPMPMREAIERSGLGKRHATALLSVAATEPISVSELAKRLGLLLSSTSTVVGELSRAGLLQREEDEEDRRRTLVRVHSDYRDAMTTWVEAATEPLRNTLERLSAPARAHFMQGWRILSEEAARSNSPRDADPDCPDT